MTAEELTNCGWKFTMRRRKSDGAVRVRAVHKQHGIDLTVWGGRDGVSEEAVRDLMIREYVQPTHELLIKEQAAA